MVADTLDGAGMRIHFHDDLMVLEKKSKKAKGEANERVCEGEEIGWTTEGLEMEACTVRREIIRTQEEQAST